MKNTSIGKFLIFGDTAATAEMERALKSGNDLVVVCSPSEYFEIEAAKKALALMKKYPARKIFVTSPVSSSIFGQVHEKAASGANLIDTYLYAEKLAKAQYAV